MKIRLAKKILFSPLYQERHANLRPAYQDPETGKIIVPDRKEKDRIFAATRRFAHWYRNKMRREFGLS